MKYLLLLFFFLILFKASNAQFDNKPALPEARAASPIIRICTPSRSSILAKPLVLVYSHNKIFVSDTATLSSLPSAAIKKVNLTNDTALIKVYGNTPRNGVLQVYIDDDKYPNAYKLLVKKDSIKIKN